ncbi:hypothetical protein F7D09_1449 [Bifidobacterium leontopitheci]|uniref:Uncharacterized protein n=1 Tax=Bifidobacterium leontopitheci TaxID=2650774 RepID=A0A6I1GU78_9BIFI|nr:hypothetical protein F7D09_1449 [Bifidobacterium leontopitheci]
MRYEPLRIETIRTFDQDAKALKSLISGIKETVRREVAAIECVKADEQAPIVVN